jgi:hypothetical protein
MFVRTCHRFLLPCLIAVPASAADFYVDVANGNDINAGTSPSLAWKTLTHASQFATSGAGTTIHVAPGTYSPATGELFALNFHDQRLVADQGPAVTIVDGGSPSATIFVVQAPGGPGVSLVQGFTLQQASRAFDATCTFGGVDVSAQDCVLRNITQAGIHAVGASAGGFNPASVNLSFLRCTFESMPIGVDHSGTFTASVMLADCLFHNCSDTGVKTLAFGSTTVLASRCRFEHDTVAGFSANVSNYGWLSASFYDCAFTRNGNGFLATPPGGLGASVRGYFWRCTIADNVNSGVRCVGLPPGVYAQAEFHGTIVQGNNGDVDVTNITGNDDSLIGTPDPQFVDRVHDDYRLRFDSPCIDAGDPATPVGALDLQGVQRPIDGNLNAHERADIGAFEFQPLRLVTSGHIGTPVRLEMSGQTGGTTTVYFARSMPVPPMSTPFGEFDLNPASYGTLLHSAVAPFPPIAFQRPIPNNAFLVGHTFSFQALTTSSIAPQGSAYTNVVSFVVLP